LIDAIESYLVSGVLGLIGRIVISRAGDMRAVHVRGI